MEGNDATLPHTMNMDISSTLFNSTSSLHEWLHQESLDSLPQVIRSASAEGGHLDYNYSFLSVGVFTLGLLLLVQWLRLSLDHVAQGRPLFKAVLERVNHELATLGIVEFVVFMLHKYYKNLDSAKEQSFSKVHYALFLVAIFNAVQSILIATLASRRSSQLWVKTEDLDISHYVEIREEFDRIDEMLYSKRNLQRQGAKRTLSSSSEEHLEFAFDWTWRAVQTLWYGLIDAFRHPILVYKHRKLLVQIRFHELKVQLINEKKLPVQLKISDYLKRSELAVFTQLVHISTHAWVMLTGALAITYFLMGMVGYVAKDAKAIGTALYYIFVVSVVLFVFVSLVVNNKMKRIFNAIVHKGSRRQGSEFSPAATPESQRKLFWAADPQLVITIFRFMEVGYSTLLAILFVFWDGFEADRRKLLIALLVCYSVFLSAVSRTLPRYTLCTSLGQLVDEERLHETLAHFRLEETKRKRRQLRDEYENEKRYSEYMNSSKLALRDEKKLHGEPSAKPFAVIETATGFLVRAAQKGADFMVHELDHVISNLSGDSVEKSHVDKGDKEHEAKAIDKHKLFSKLVLKNTSSLRRVWKQEADSSSDKVGTNRSSRSNRLQQPVSSNDRERPKTIPDSTPRSVMSLPPAKLSSSPDLRSVASRQNTAELSTTGERLARETIMAMVHMDTSTLRSLLPRESPDVSESAARAAALRDLRRKSRRKALSDGVAAMCQVTGMSAAAQMELSTSTTLSATENVEDAGAVAARAKSEAAGSSPNRTRSRARRVRQKSFSESAAIQAMQERSLSFNEMISPDSKIILPQRAMKSAPDLQHVDFAIPEVLSDDSRNSGVRRPDKLSSYREQDDDDDDDMTMNSEESQDGQSDSEDIPEISSHQRQKATAIADKTPFREKIRAYYLGKRFQLVSTVLGTLPALFLVGMRVELLLDSSHVIPLAENTFKLLPSACFWVEVALLASFVLTSLYIMIIFRPRACENNQERSALAAASLDFIISSACFVVLFVAEAKRCCNNEKHAGRYLETIAATSEHASTTSCCPRLGQRTYGGLGNIEPFTSIIILRVLRFTVAAHVVHWFDKRLGWTLSKTAEPKEEEDVGGEVEDSNQTGTLDAVTQKSKRKMKEEELGTIVDLWERALGHFPEIAARYGEFSGELLQAMLGIDIVESAESKDQLSSSFISTEHQPPIAMQENGIASKPIQNILLNEKRYSRLVPAVQSIIIAGRLGKSVKSTRRLNIESDSLENLPVSDEDPSRRASMKPRLPSRDEPPLQSTSEALEFEIDSSEAGPEMENTFVEFSEHPNSVLVRSMRRCDRKFLPILGNWAVVDVVLTKYELVYFHVAAEMDFISQSNPQTSHKFESICKAIEATHGGKGLRLCDVAFGRKFAGGIKLADCINARVDRLLPSTTATGESFAGGNGEENAPMETVQAEYWRHAGQTGQDTSRNARWERTKEDHLVLSTANGTLHLRFYGDLDYSEAHAVGFAIENDTDAVLHKNNALQWCQTIVRFCGIDQLKQNLPHFGDNNDDELRDYLQVIDRSDAHQRRGLVGASQLLMRRQHHRMSTPDLVNIVIRMQRFSRRTSTAGDAEEVNDTGSNHQSDGPVLSRLQMPMRISRRSVSWGDAGSDMDDRQSDSDNNIPLPLSSSLHFPVHLRSPGRPARRRFRSTGGETAELPTLVEYQGSGGSSAAIVAAEKDINPVV